MEAVNLVLEQGLNNFEVGRQLGVHATTIRDRVKEYQSDSKNSFPGKGKLKPDEAEIKKILDENKRLKMDNEFL